MADLTGMLQAAAGAAPTGEYEIERSLRFNSADSAYLNRTPASATNRRTWTWSGWVKRAAFGTTQGLFARNDGSVASYFIWNSNNKLEFTSASAGIEAQVITTPVYRDASAWYHVMCVLDTTQGTSSNRVKLYVNGVQVTALDTATYPSQNYDTYVNTTATHYIGNGNPGGSLGWYSNQYLTEINFIDGQALTPSSFGQIDSATGVWSPIEYTGTYGTNGFYLNFSDNSNTTASTLGKDYSGNGNNWTPNNFSVTAGVSSDSVVDTPTRYGTDTGVGNEVRGNYATINPIGSFNTTTTQGNLYLNINALGVATGTIAVSSGKWYWEVFPFQNGNRCMIGIGDASKVAADLQFSDSGGGWYYYGDDGKIYNNNSSTAYGATFNNDQWIGVALDMDAGTVTFYKNNVSQGTAVTGLSGKTIIPCFGTDIASATEVAMIVNFGQQAFNYTAPSGFKALVTTNLPNPTIVQGDDYFNTVLYTGTGSSQSITGVGFQPDFVWIKERNAAADHGLYDAVRGVQQQLESNTTTDETTESTGLTAFGTNGFTVGSLAQLNTNNDTYVAWNWKESTTSKFDIVTYTGNGSARTISHNLGVVPNMIIVKARTTASTDQGWPVYHSANTAAPATDYLLLNSTAATADLDTVWNDTLPTSSVFSVGTNALVNANNDTYVAYLFANVAGYSAFGSYTGNGSADGAFVYTGFRPAFLIVKRSNNVSEWFISDATRNPSNAVDKRLVANAADAEDTQLNFDYLSNGFKLRSTSFNGNGDTMIYMAFAESPFKVSLGR